MLVVRISTVSSFSLSLYTQILVHTYTQTATNGARKVRGKGKYVHNRAETNNILMAGGKSSKKKVQLGVKPIGGSNVVKSRKMARRITSQFHVIQKRKQKILAMPNGNERESKLNELEAELHSLGGIDRYQQASVVSTQHFKTSKWVLQALRRLGKLPSDNKLKTLEVGAINDQLYQSQSLDVRAIDVNSQLPCIEECDFFNVLPEFQYDVVVCSMVINCVFHPFKRGEMLLR